jgi:hypothetical protein
MGKYVADLPSKNPERTLEKVETYLRRQGFWKTGGPGKEVWRRPAKTRLISPEYIAVAARADHVHLEAWIRAITPFVGLWVGKVNPLKGAPFSFPSKDRLRGRIEQIERLVR